MQPFVGGGEQSNVPTTPEEVAAAESRRQDAEKREQAAHEAARNAAATAAAEARKKAEDVQEFAHDLQRSVFNMAVATNTTPQYLNALLYAAGVMLAAVPSPEEETRMLDYIKSTATALKKSRTDAANKQEGE